MAVVQIMKKDYPSAINLFMFKSPIDIVAIMGKTAVGAPAPPATGLQVRAFYEATPTVFDDIMRRQTGDIAIGMKFNASHSYTITAAEMKLSRFGAPASTCWLSIYDITGSVPDTLLATTNLVNMTASWDNGAEHWRLFNFKNPIAVTGTTPYALVVESNCATDNSNYLKVRGTTTEAQMHPSAVRVDQQQGGGWSKDISIDHSFRIWGTYPNFIPTELQDAFEATPNEAVIGGSGGAFAQGNTFIPSVNYNIASVAFPLEKNNTPVGSVWCELRNWNATIAEPTDLIERTNAIDVSTLPLNGQMDWVGFQWRSNPQIIAGKMYSIFGKIDFNFPSGGGNNVGQGYQPGDNYSSGQQIYQLYTASAWNAVGADFGFKSYGKTA